VERCLACEAVLSKAEGVPQGHCLSALLCVNRQKLRYIERWRNCGMPRDVPLLTTASQARQRSTGWRPPLLTPGFWLLAPVSHFRYPFLK
jgi:hypothetical protein